MPALSELQRTRSKILADSANLLARGLKSSSSKRDFESLLTQADRLERDIQAIEKAERITSVADAERAAREAANASPSVRRAQLNAAFRDAVKHGENPSRKEQRDLNSLVSAAS